MRYAIFSDVHGNRQAWAAVRADLDALHVQVCVCLGDVVGYGPCPQEVLLDIRSRTENMVMGNHDAAAAGLIDDSVFEPSARETLQWTRQHLDEDSLKFLAGMPLVIEDGPLLFVHAEIAQPGRFTYLDQVAVAWENFAAGHHHITFVGHTHHPTVFRLDEGGAVQELPAHDCILSSGRRYIVNVGSVGEPRSLNDLRASYVIYDTDTQVLYFRRLAFDHEGYRRDLISSGLQVTPWFLAVADHQRVTAADRALTECVATPLEPEVRTLMVPPGVASQGSATARPAPRPTPARQRRRSTGGRTLALLSVLALIAAVSVLVATQLLKRYGNEETVASASDTPSSEPATSRPVKPAGETPPGDGSTPNEVAANPPEAEAEPEPAPEPDPEPEPAPVVAEVPDPAPPPEPGANAKPPPDPGPAPIPPEPANLAGLTRLSEGLIFYVSLDEEESEFTANDMSSGGRHLDIANARPGASGQVGFACRLKKEGGLLSEAKPLPEMKAVTISFWIRRPEPPPPEDPAEEPPTEKPAAPPPAIVDPPMNLVSIKDYCDVRLEDNYIVADLDRQGSEARLYLHRDRRWHHVLVENGGGRTSIWIDHRSQSEPNSETLPAAPAGGVSVLIGGAKADFYVDEVAIWNRVFTPEERQLLYRRGRLDDPIISPAKTLAYWSFDEKAGARLFEDGLGRHPLGAYKAWKPLRGIAPNPVPLTQKPNVRGAQLWHVAGRADDAESFQLKSDAPFTYEGWIKLGSSSAGSLGGTITASNEQRLPGWRLAVRPDKGSLGFLAFIYDTGSENIQAVSNALPIYDGLAHHFAAVWNPMSAQTQGSIELYIDNEKVANASLALSKLGTVSKQPFRIAVRGTPIIFDELRFSSGAYQPTQFLTAGMASFGTEAATEQPDKEETILQRRDREARERKANKGKKK